MAISTIFQRLVDMVDATKVLVFVLNTSTYGANEWSYSGLTITGGSEEAQEHGARALLHAMGVRYYGPNPELLLHLPASIPTGLTATKQSNWWSHNRMFLGAGHLGGVASKVILDGWRNDWFAFNNLRDLRVPHGHRWQSVIIDQMTWFQAHPGYILGGAPVDDDDHFDLDSLIDADGTVTNSGGLAELAELCAAYLLNVGLNSLNRTNFDPADGSPFTAEQVFRFSKAVVDKMRMGTAAIGTIAAKTGVPTAQIGVLSYSKHANPTGIDFSIAGIYVSITLAFNYTGLTLNELADRWGAKADFITLYDYYGVEVWTYGWAMANSRNKKNYAVKYTAFKNGGALGTDGETDGNWLVNLPGHFAIVQHLSTGVANYDTIIQEITDNLFNGDPKVAQLYTTWQLGSVPRNKYTLRDWFDIVAEMEDASWWKLAFQQILVIFYKHLNIPAQTDGGYGAAFSDLMSNARGILDEMLYGSYPLFRQMSANLITTWIALRWNAVPAPNWMTSPVAPTESDFNDAHAVLTSTVFRPIELNASFDDSVLVRGLTPLVTGTNADQSIYVKSTSNFALVGPGTACFLPEGSSDVQRKAKPAGVHLVVFSGQGKAWAEDGGLIFLQIFPAAEFQNFNTTTYGFHDLYVYVPQEVEGVVDISALESIVTIAWNGGEVALTLANTDSTVIPSGLCLLKQGNPPTRERVLFGNVNPWASPYPDKMLMAPGIAASNFPNRMKITPPYLEGTDDTTEDAIPATD